MTGSLRRLLPGCLFLTGASALALEVAWSRTLSLSLGNSHQAVATVVASMMTGLCLGSLLASRALPRLSDLPRAYGLVEMGVGAYAALTPLIFRALPALLAPAYALPAAAFNSIRFLVVFLVLLPACSGMGATLPLVTAALSRMDPGEAGRVGGRLYGVNTLGAFLGTLAGGFLLLPSLGLLKTTLVGAATSLGVGSLIWLLAAPPPKARPTPRQLAHPSTADGSAAWVLPLYAVSGALAMVYEVTWTRVLAPIAGTSVYSFTLILAAILAGIGLGSLTLSTPRASRLDPGRGFVAGQIILSVTAFLSIWGLEFFPDLMLSAAARTVARPEAFLLWQFLLFGFIVLLPGVVLGALFPFAASLLRRLEREAGAAVGRVYAWNTAGSIVGALAAGFFLVERLGSERTLVLACAGSATLGLAALPLASGRRFRPMAGTLAACLALAFPFLVPSWDLYRMTSGITQVIRNLRKETPKAPGGVFRALVRAPDARIDFHREGRTSTVTVVREWADRWLRVDGKTDASTTPGDMLTQVLLGHLPFFFARQPGASCVIGYGSGVTSHAVLTHPVRLVDTIEIERQVIEASPLFEQVNLRPLEDPRSRLILEDARTALLYRPQTYDVMVSEPSNPWMAGVNNLFTSEFYALVRKRLKPGGVFCQWIQSYELSNESLQTIVSTLAAAFPHTHLFASHLSGDMILLASDEPLTLAPGAADLFPDRPGVKADLERIGIGNLADVAILYTTPIPAPPPGTALNGDDLSPIQYRAPLELLRGVEPSQITVTTSILDLLRIFLPGISERDALVQLGHAASRRDATSLVEAIAGYLEEKGHLDDGKAMTERAAAIRRRLDHDAEVGRLLLEAESRGQARDAEGSLAATHQAEALGLETAEQQSRTGYVLLNVGRYAEAEKHFDAAVTKPSPNFLYQSLAGRGATRFRLGRREEGLADLTAAKKLYPDLPIAYLLYGLALYDAGEREAAFREFDEGLRVAPSDPRILGTIEYLSSLPNRPASTGPAAASPGS